MSPRNLHCSRRTLLALLGAGGILSRRQARAAGSAVSGWVGVGQAQVRLVDAGPLAGRRLAGIEIRLDPDVLTYWRTPGEAGVPPTADFSRSTNLKSAALDFPAPGRFDEGGAEAFGYKDGVVFPVIVEPLDPAKPIDLALDLAFAICAKLCLPARATAGLRLSDDGAGFEANRVRDALAQVPNRRDLGADGPLGITSVTLTPDGSSVVAIARTSGETAPALFPEAPDPWFLQADGGTPAGPGLTRFTLKILARPPAGAASLPLRLTLVGETAAIEVVADLDAAPHKP